MRTLLLLVLCLAGAAVAVRADGPSAEPAAGAGLAGAPDLVTEIYDLHGLWPSRHGEQVVLSPLPFPFAPGDDEGAWEPEDGSSMDRIVALIWSTVAPGEFEYEGRRLEALDDDSLLVTAPATVQDVVRRTLEQLERATRRQAHLAIDLWRANRELEPEALADSAGLERVQAAGALVLLANRTEQVELGRTASFEALTRRPIVRDWDVEIAQTSAAARPVIEVLSVGTRLALRLEQGPGEAGCTLRFLSQLSELRALEQRSDPVRALVFGDAGQQSTNVAGTFDQPAVAFATLAGSGPIAPGGELITFARTRTLEGPVGYVVRYRLLSVDPAPAPLELQAGSGAVLRVADVSAGLWRHLDAPRLTDKLMFPLWEWGDEAMVLRFPGQEPGDVGSLVERALAARAATFSGDDAPWDLGPYLVLAGPPADLDAVEQGLRDMLPPRRGLLIELALTETGRDGAPLEQSRLVLPVSTGDAAMAVLGSARLLLVGFEVDVAQQSAVADADVRGCLDGLLVRAEADASGEVALTLASHRVLHRERVDLHVPSLPPVDRPEIALSTATLRLAPDGAWQVRPDVADVSGGGAALALRCRVTTAHP